MWIRPIRQAPRFAPNSGATQGRQCRPQIATFWGRQAHHKISEQRMWQLAEELIRQVGAFPDKSIISGYEAGPAVARSSWPCFSRAGSPCHKGAVPILPDRFEAGLFYYGGDLGGAAVIVDFELFDGSTLA